MQSLSLPRSAVDLVSLVGGDTLALNVITHAPALRAMTARRRTVNLVSTREIVEQEWQREVNVNLLPAQIPRIARASPSMEFSIVLDVAGIYKESAEINTLGKN